jgi:hypothetical protein
MDEDEDNDGKFPDESPVEVRYPRSKQEEQADWDTWSALQRYRILRVTEPLDALGLQAALDPDQEELAERVLGAWSATPPPAPSARMLRPRGLPPRGGGRAGHGKAGLPGSHGMVSGRSLR